VPQYDLEDDDINKLIQIYSPLL